MNLYGQPNHAGLTVYLQTLGLDADKIAQEGADATGYNELAIQPDGRPITESSSGVIRQAYIRKEWPNDTVWPKVKHLLDGGGLDEIDEPPVVEAPKEPVVETPKPKATK